MENLLLALIIVAGGVWIGSIVFQSAVVAPGVFTTLDEPQARVLLRTLFPRFFKLGIGCGVVVTAAATGLIAANGFGTASVAVLMVGLATIALPALALRLVPAINAARDGGVETEARFHKLHRLSVLLTVGSLLLAAAVIAWIPAGFGASAAGVS